MLSQQVQPATLQCGFVIIGNAIKAGYGMALPQQALRQVKANKASGTGNEYLYGIFFRRVLWPPTRPAGGKSDCWSAASDVLAGLPPAGLPTLVYSNPCLATSSWR